MKRITAFVVLLVAGPVAADDLKVYESIDDIEIGRVFLTTSERSQLDRLRNAPVVAAASNDTPGEPAPTQETARPAGFIQNTAGERQSWQGGDFVSGARDAAIRFPGAIHIQRHAAKDAEQEDDAAGSE